MRWSWVGAVALGVALAGCTTGPKAVVTVAAGAPVEQPTGWRATATADDQARIEGLGDRMQRMLSAVPAGARARVAAEMPLLDPKSALDAPALSPGSYQCRLVRIGGRRGVVSYKSDFCYIAVEGGKQSFTKQTGTQLPGGWLFDDDKGKRLIFLGTLRPQQAPSAPPYGQVRQRDVAAVIERIAPFRWRMALVKNDGQGDQMLDIYELIPVVNGSS
ncbi:DUF4893 domain-containing protein [Sphingomonas asaccharolytica]|uniref:DUF4893 domain-containing protein n=1 Tax=Sphingomonas asaccharolytica TaxID=40681 RepID=UPI0008360572|nr:DUF4893 domain-containing protein [Sphingomonas asaccharolytica]